MTSIFRRLRNRLILINVAVTTIVLVVAFASIYLVAQEAAAHRPIGTFSATQTNEETSITISTHIRAERNASLRSLLISLFTVGILVEFVVMILSYIWAETAIQPVRDSYEAQKTFIANASHEIKTPLAAISANLEAANISGNRWIDNTELEVQKLTALNQELLTLTRIDGGSVTPGRPETVEMASFLQTLTDSFASRLQEQKVQLHAEIVPLDAKLSFIKADCEHILTILLDNAIKYSDKKVTLRYQDKKITVENDGAKITKKDLPHIFERFYQADKSSPGVGLGLAIANSLAEHNHWHLTVASDRSTRFTLDLS